MQLFAFPCKFELAEFFCDRRSVAGGTALILRKQEAALGPLLKARGVREVVSLPEDFYGRVTSAETGRLLGDLSAVGCQSACLPLNDFLGNAALLLRLLAPQVSAINATSKEDVELKFPKQRYSFNVTDHVVLREVQEIQETIVTRLRDLETRLSGMATGSHAGERPSQGLVQNFPYDCEVLSRYAYAAQNLSGNVVEVGCGIGYGAYLMAELNTDLHIRALDHDDQAIELARSLWGDNPRLSFEVSAGESLPCAAEEFQGAVCFEVIEHVVDPAVLLQEIQRVLTPGGRLIGSTPNSFRYPYRVFRGEAGTPEELRQAGIWYWHIQEFTEATLLDALEKEGFGQSTVGYPTFSAGIDSYQQIAAGHFCEGLNVLSRLSWSVADFVVSDQFQPGFSGYSFLFMATKQVTHDNV